MRRTTVNNLLQQKETEQGEIPKNIENKLIFLREIGLISYYDDKWVVVDQSAVDKFKDATQKLHAAVCWLEQFKFINRDRKSKQLHIFSVLVSGPGSGSDLAAG